MLKNGPGIWKDLKEMQSNPKSTVKHLRALAYIHFQSTETCESATWHTLASISSTPTERIVHKLRYILDPTPRQNHQ